LLVAMIAAVAITLRTRKDAKSQAPHKQIAVRRDERVRMVRMPSEPRTPSAAPDAGPNNDKKES